MANEGNMHFDDEFCIYSKNSLLLTNLTWEYLEYIVRSCYNVSASFGTLKRYLIKADSAETPTLSILIDPAWENLKDDEADVPKMFYIKFLKPVLMMARGGENKQEWTVYMRDLHNREIDMHEFFKDHTSEHLKLMKSVKMEAIVGDNLNDGFMLFEYKHSLEPLEAWKPLVRENILPLIRCLAAYSAFHYKNKAKCVANLKKSNYFRKRILDIRDEMSEPGFKTLCNSLAPENSSLFSDALAICRQYYFDEEIIERFSNVPDYFGYKPQLLVSDLSSMPMFCTRFSEEPDGLQFSALSKLQDASIGCPCQDLACLVAVAMANEQVDIVTAKVIQLYYNTYINEIDILREQAPFTIEQLTRSFKLFYPPVAMITFVQVINHFKNHRQNKTIRDISTNLLSNIVRRHRKNVKNFGEFFSVASNSRNN